MRPKKTDKKQLAGAGLAYSYLRFSTPEQSEGDSQSRQDTMRDDYLSRNKLKLDTSFTLRDLGLSGFHGTNRSKGDLGLFLQAIREGRTKAGATFIVENLDRLSREDPFTQFDNLKTIIIEGQLKLVSLQPFYEVDTDTLTSNPGIMFIIMGDVMRGHQESQRKQDLALRNWSKKGEQAKAGEKILTRRCPEWLKPKADLTGFDLIPEKVKTVRQIVKWAIEGFGITAITRKLNGSGVPIIATLNGKKKKSQTWHRSYIGNILRDKRLIGELERGDWDGTIKKSIKNGEVLEGYYPAIISTEDFYRMQQGCDNRKTLRGRESRTCTNLFKGIIRDARDGKMMHALDKGRKSTGVQLVSSGARRGEIGSQYVSVRYDALETAVLRWLEGFNPNSISAVSTTQDQLDAKRGELNEVEAKIATTENRMMDEDDFDSLANVLKKLQTRRAGIIGDIEALQQQLHTEGADDYASVIELLNLMPKMEGQERDDLRVKLRAVLQSIIAEIWVLATATGRYTRDVTIQIYLKNGVVQTLSLLTKRLDRSVSWQTRGDVADLREFRNQRPAKKSAKLG